MPSASGQMTWTERPVFIWGMQKTGSSLLQNLVDGHPRLVAYPAELHIKYFLSRQSPETEADLRHRYLLEEWKGRISSPLKAAANRGEFRFPPNRLGVSQEDLLAAFDPQGYFRDLSEALERPMENPTDLFRRDIIAFYRNLRQPPADPAAWTFKMVGGNPSVVDAFWSGFPEGRVIYIVRDPRGGANSRLKDWSKKGATPDARKLLLYLLKYRAHYRFLSGLVKRTPQERLLVLRYEDVVAETESTMRRVCAFIGVAFDPCTLTPSALGKPSPVWNATKDNQGIFRDSIDGWKTQLSQHNRRMVETVFRGLWGRPPFRYPATLPRLALTWNAFRMNRDRSLARELESMLPSYVGFDGI